MSLFLFIKLFPKIDFWSHFLRFCVKKCEINSATEPLVEQGLFFIFLIWWIYKTHFFYQLLSKLEPKYRISDPSLLEFRPSSSLQFFETTNRLQFLGIMTSFQRTKKENKVFNLLRILLLSWKKLAEFCTFLYVEGNFIGMFNPFVRFAEQKLAIE